MYLIFQLQGQIITQMYNKEILHHGTYGKFEIDIDASGTETDLMYTININFENKPNNLKFYFDENLESEIKLNDNIMNLRDSIKHQDSGILRTNVIYWNWAFETGDTEEEKEKNDIIDSEFLGKTLRHGN